MHLCTHPNGGRFQEDGGGCLCQRGGGTEVVNETFKELLKAYIQHKLAKENLTKMGKLTPEQKKALEKQRCEEKQAQSQAVRDALMPLSVNGLL